MARYDEAYDAPYLPGGGYGFERGGPGWEQARRPRRGPEWAPARRARGEPPRRLRGVPGQFPFDDTPIRMGMHDFTEHYGRYSGGSPDAYEVSERTIYHEWRPSFGPIGFSRPLRGERRPGGARPGGSFGYGRRGGPARRAR